MGRTVGARRDANGVVTGEKTDLVYNIDAVRGIDLLRVGLPSTGGGPAPDIDDENDPGDSPATVPATGSGAAFLFVHH